MTQHWPPRLFRSESIGQSLSVYLPATVLSRLVGLSRGLLLTYLMVQRQYGLLQIALLVANLLHPLCCAGLNDSVQRYVPMHETRGTLRRFLRLALPLVLVTGAVLAGVVLVLARPIGGFLFAALGTGDAAAEAGAATALTRMAAIAAFGLIGFFFILSTLKGLRMYRAIGLIELTSNTAFAVLAAIVCWRGFDSAWLVVGCYAAAMLAMSAVVCMPLRRAVGRIEPRAGHGQAAPSTAALAHATPHGRDAILPGTDANAVSSTTVSHLRGETAGTEAGRYRGSDAAHPDCGVAKDGFSGRAVVGQMLRFSLWSALAAITWQVLLGYPMWYLNKAAGPTAASVFAGVALLAQGMVIVANSVVTVVETAVTKTWEARGPGQANRDLLLVYKAAALVLLAGGAAAAVMAPLIVRILPAQYASGLAILPLLVLFFLLAGHLLFLGIHFHLIERTRHVFIPWLLGVCGHVGFSMWLIRPGMNAVEAQTAAAWAGLAGMSVALTAALVLVVAERRPMDGGLWILIAAGFALAGPRAWAPPVMLAVVVALTLATEVILTGQQKERLWRQVLAGRRTLAGLLGGNGTGGE